jgi:hypothetical protein
MTDQEQEQARQFEKTARWLVRESEKLARLSAGVRDRRAREIARRCELLQKEIHTWSEKD